MGGFGGTQDLVVPKVWGGREFKVSGVAFLGEGRDRSNTRNGRAVAPGGSWVPIGGPHDPEGPDAPEQFTTAAALAFL